MGLKDYSDEVLALDQDLEGAVVWQSADLEGFGKNGKINFLRVTNDGLIILDVFKPGCHFQREIHCASRHALSEIRAYLSQNPLVKWSDISTGWQDGSTEDTPSGVFAFHREKQILPTLKIIWKGRHINPEKS